MTVQMIIHLSRDQQVEVEEYCAAKGLTFSEYFVRLHEEKQIAKEESISRDVKNPPMISDTKEEREKNQPVGGEGIQPFIETDEIFNTPEEMIEDFNKKLLPTKEILSCEKKRGRPSKNKEVEKCQ